MNDLSGTFARVAFALTFLVGSVSYCEAQSPEFFTGDAVPRDIREMYEKGLTYLAKTQTEEGNWQDSYANQGGEGLAIMCFLASGEDPNFGLYSGNIKRALRSMISKQNAETGYIGNSMYLHGFSMLALSESYGVVDDRNLWSGSKESPKRSIGQALELAVRTAITSQKKNPLGSWRYSPDATDADTSAAGAVLMGLLGARNAGIEVPDESIERAIAYFVSMTAPSGQVAYSGGLGGFDESMARISIAALVYSVARRKDLPQFKSTLTYITDKVEGGSPGHGGIEYQNYYQAQALFQGNVQSWEKWNKNLVRHLKTVQQNDGSFRGSHGNYVSTTLSLLALAVNYRFLPIYER
ncbi:squalene--hopene cyclase [Planctomicrobium sp. SH668]|uniref:squalene--hopene cyclase n=1 Tax=Planctomicrobium sp. SH668 TaxID=3448126 RepID=UPI003F5B9718